MNGFRVWVKASSCSLSFAVCFQGLARHSRGVRRRFLPDHVEISLVSSLHRASTDALMFAYSLLVEIWLIFHMSLTKPQKQSQKRVPVKE